MINQCLQIPVGHPRIKLHNLTTYKATGQHHAQQKKLRNEQDGTLQRLS